MQRWMEESRKYRNKGRLCGRRGNRCPAKNVISSAISGYAAVIVTSMNLDEAGRGSYVKQ